jgi:hypothetical protein
MDFKNNSNLGYAFVDLSSEDCAHSFFDAFSGFCDQGFSLEQECQVCWSTLQGHQSHVERYRNSPVMHESVPDDFKPLLFVDGQRIPFPEPTKRIREPHNWVRSVGDIGSAKGIQSSTVIEQSAADHSSLPFSLCASDRGCLSGEMHADEQRTTCMLRNIPEAYTRNMLLELIDNGGFAKKYSLVYLPMDFKTKKNLGYAFFDFISTDVAQQFIDAFSGFCDSGFSISEKFEVCWSTVQGYPAHVERYRDSPVMHHLVPDDFKPLLFVDGQRIPFPEPTKRIREPRHWKRNQE